MYLLLTVISFEGSLCVPAHTFWSNTSTCVQVQMTMRLCVVEVNMFCYVQCHFTKISSTTKPYADMQKYEIQNNTIRYILK